MAGSLQTPTTPRSQRTNTWASLFDQLLTGRTTTLPAVGPSRLGTVIAVAGAGLLVTGLGYAMARTGHETPVLPMFFAGLVAIFVPCAWRLTSGTAARFERLAVSLVLGVGLLASYYMRSPLIFDWFDELIHGATLNGFLRSRTLLVHNGILPVSPFYPGLELLTVGVKWLTGLPVVLAQLVVVLAQQVVVVMCVFLVVERVCRSARAGGIGVLVYAANPSFYTSASWDYGSLALAFAVATVHFVLSSLHARARTAAPFASDSPDFASDSSAPFLPSRRGFVRTHRDFLLALASMAALVVTHHLTAWLTAGFLVAWAVGLWIDHRPKDARVVGLAAASSVVLVSGWTAFVGSHLVSYLGPLFSDAASGFGSAIEHQNSRPLFHTYSHQGGSSFWEIVLMLAAAGCFCLLLCPSGLAVIRKRTALHGVLRFLPVAVAAGYPLAMLGSISSGSSQVGERTTTFIFFGMAVVIGGWLATLLPKVRGPLIRTAMVLIATVCFLGSMIFGSGPDVTYVPGPYLVGANQRSVSAPSLAVAQWAATHLAAGSNIAADRQSGALVADYADVNIVTSISGLLNPGPLFFSTKFDRHDRSLIRKDHIRYIVVDLRLASSLPLFGTYLEAGEAEPGTRLTLAELSKFDSVPGIERIYDNGPFQVYDVSRLLGESPSGLGAGGAASTGTDPVVLVAAVAVAIVGFIGVRRRRRFRITDRAVVRWTVGAMVAAIVVAVATLPTQLTPTAVGLGGLAALLVVGLVATRAVPPDIAVPKGTAVSHPVDACRLSKRQRVYTAAGIVLVVVGVLLATVTARKEWQPPDQLALKVGLSGQEVVTAQLATASTGAYLVVVDPHQLFVLRQLQATTLAQTVVVPDSIARGSYKVLLIAPGSSLAVWS
jgi:hypothetical protein